MKKTLLNFDDMRWFLSRPFLPRHMGFGVWVLLVGLLLMGVCRGAPEVGHPELRVISSRPDSVSGDSALVEVNGAPQADWLIRVNGAALRQEIRTSGSSGLPVLLVTGMRRGNNTVELVVSGSVRASLNIANHSLSGPIFSGPQQTPFVCETEPNGLGATTNADCNAKTIVQYYYKSNRPLRREQFPRPHDDSDETDLTPGFKAYDPSQPPDDVAETVTTDGHRVKYVVRRELGVINRAVYEIQFLHLPGQPLPNPWASLVPGWNRKLIYYFGGGCGSGFHQGRLGPAGSPQEIALSQGFATATSTLNIFGNNCNDRVSAETLSMVKEKFIKEFGRPLHTIGEGGSGGAMQVYLIAQNYPGLLDGIIAQSSFPDVVTYVESGADCPLLDHALSKSSNPWTDEQKTAVSGFATWRSCLLWTDGRFPLLNPNGSCDSSIPQGSAYSPEDNTSGIRCDLYNNEINVFGRNPHTGTAFRPLDNVGVQYGLVALNSGEISIDQFIELNSLAGGYDRDGNIISERTHADPQAIRLAYQRGLVLTGEGDLGRIPIIDWRSYVDDLTDNHDRFRSFATRARILAANGRAGNQVILVDPGTGLTAMYGNLPVLDQRIGELERLMDLWLTKVESDRDAGPISQKLLRNKPVELSDGCWRVDGKRIVEDVDNFGLGSCSRLYPMHGDPRIAAGGPLSDDVLKCTLKPMSVSDYTVPLTKDQFARLKSIFPQGVCDYKARGIEQQGIASTWQKYGENNREGALAER